MSSPLPPSKTPEARRLRRFTTDPDYGPKLVRLPKREQRQLLDMVTGGQGRQARKDLLTRYEARREADNSRRRALRRAKAESSAMSNLSRRLPEAHNSTLEENVQRMSYRELRFAGDASRDELKQAARSGSRVVKIDGKDKNLFWYH